MNVLTDNDELLKYVEIWNKLYSIKSLIKKGCIIDLYMIMNT